MAHSSLLADHPQGIGWQKIYLHIIIGAITEPLNNPFDFASLCCSLILAAHPFDCCDWCLVANRFALLRHSITQIRLKRVTHLLCFYLTSLFEFRCAVMRWGIIHTMVVYSLTYSFMAVYGSICNHCLYSHSMSCLLPFFMPWRSFFRFNKKIF